MVTTLLTYVLHELFQSFTNSRTPPCFDVAIAHRWGFSIWLFVRSYSLSAFLFRLLTTGTHTATPYVCESIRGLFSPDWWVLATQDVDNNIRPPMYESVTLRPRQLVVLWSQVGQELRMYTSFWPMSRVQVPFGMEVWWLTSCVPVTNNTLHRCALACWNNFVRFNSIIQRAPWSRSFDHSYVSMTSIIFACWNLSIVHCVVWEVTELHLFTSYCLPLHETYISWPNYFNWVYQWCRTLHINLIWVHSKRSWDCERLRVSEVWELVQTLFHLPYITSLDIAGRSEF